VVAISLLYTETTSVKAFMVFWRLKKISWNLQMANFDGWMVIILKYFGQNLNITFETK